MNRKKVFAVCIMLIIFFTMSIHNLVVAAITGIVNKETVRVRKEATTDSPIVMLVSIGDKITVISKEGDWYKVKVKDKTGYIREDLLDIEGEASDNKDNTSETNNNTVENNNSNSNEDANVGNNQNGNQTQEPEQNQGGENVENNEEQPTENPSEDVENPNDIPEDGKETNNKTITIETLELAEEQRTVGVKIILAKDTSLKILPLVNSSDISKVPEGSEVEILEIINSWCKIGNDEFSGWIRLK